MGQNELDWSLEEVCEWIVWRYIIEFLINLASKAFIICSNALHSLNMGNMVSVLASDK
jgi:hypothetical protein